MMTVTSIVQLLMKYAPLAIETVPAVQKIVADYKAGKGQTVVSDADWQALIDAGNETSADIYAKLGIPLPPRP